jgi:hypothetical protein
MTSLLGRRDEEVGAGNSIGASKVETTNESMRFATVRLCPGGHFNRRHGNRDLDGLSPYDLPSPPVRGRTLPLTLGSESVA